MIYVHQVYTTTLPINKRKNEPFLHIIDVKSAKTPLVFYGCGDVEIFLFSPGVCSSLSLWLFR